MAGHLPGDVGGLGKLAPHGGIVVLEGIPNLTSR